MSGDNYGDPGPRARWAAIEHDPALLGIVLQRLADGDSVRAILRAWGIPAVDFRAWLRSEGKRLVRAAATPRAESP